jgi:cell shape-determining protein MreD
MILLPHLVGFLSLLLLQTAIVPQFRFLANGFDLLIAWVIFLGLYRPLREGWVAVLAAGLVMDSLTGSGFGVYTTSYFWLWLMMRGLPRVIHLHHMAILPAVVAMGVLFENAVIVLAFYVLPPGHPIPEAGLRAVLVQVLWALTMGYPLLRGFGSAWRRWERWSRRRLTPWMGSA